MSSKQSAARSSDPVAWLEKYPTRWRLVHLKDTKRAATKNVMDLASTDAGTGIVPWRDLVDLVAHAHVEHLFVEHEEPFATTPMDAARNDYAFLTKLFNGNTSTETKR